MRTEIHTVAELEAFIAERGGLAGAVVQGLDLRGHGDAVAACSSEGAVFLGCHFDEATRDHVLATGGLLFPRLRGFPFQPYRPSLYTAEELLDGYRRGDPASWKDSLDQRVYSHASALRERPGPMPILEALAQRLHDHAIDNGVEELLFDDPPARVVAIMGGHGMRRTDDAFRDVTLIAHALAARGYLMASGGGPGAMEATHLGAWLADRSEGDVDAALAILAAAPDYHHELWIETALEVRERFPGPRPSLGVPTWFYGHEPPNLFATHIAKYFSNSLREDGLLAIARHGVVYAPGSAGTIQEIFMDAAQNHYGTFHEVSPMVFLGASYWSDDKPVFPLLERLAAGRQYARFLAIADSVDEAVSWIVSNPPQPFADG